MNFENMDATLKPEGSQEESFVFLTLRKWNVFQCTSLEKRRCMLYQRKHHFLEATDLQKKTQQRKENSKWDWKILCFVFSVMYIL